MGTSLEMQMSQFTRNYINVKLVGLDNTSRADYVVTIVMTGCPGIEIITKLVGCKKHNTVHFTIHIF